MNKSKSLKVAAIQMVCAEGKVDDNLKYAEGLVQQAVNQGAELVLLPELMPSGYLATEEIWDYAETMRGKSVNWLKNIAKQHGIYLGFSFLEAEGEHFYNAFVLATPAGDIAGRVRKTPPASIEAHFYIAGNEPHVIETDIGRIGVSICYENLLYDRICELTELDVDLVLSPSAAGGSKVLFSGDLKRTGDMLKRARTLYSSVLGVPNVMTNRAGILETDLPGGLPHLKGKFLGLSMIGDADGRVLTEFGEDDEGVLVAEIELNPAKKKKVKPKKHGRMWAVSVPWFAFIWPITQKTGEKAYQNNPRRAEKAKQISKGFSAVLF